MTDRMESNERHRNIEQLLGLHAGATIFVLGSGPSMDFFPPDFFKGKLTIGVNEVHRRFPCTYTVQHHNENLAQVLDHPTILVTSEFNCGQYDWGVNELPGEQPYYFYRHSDSKQCKSIDLKALERTDSLAISASTTAEAVHLAHHMGAATIILCGCDHGRIDGKINFEGYNDNGDGLKSGTTPAHLPMTEGLLLQLVNELRKRGRAVVSLSPFINPGMEGHKYSRPPAGMVYMPTPQAQEAMIKNLEIPGHKPAGGVA